MRRRLPLVSRKCILASHIIMLCSELIISAQPMTAPCVRLFSHQAAGTSDKTAACRRRQSQSAGQAFDIRHSHSDIKSGKPVASFWSSSTSFKIRFKISYSIIESVNCLAQHKDVKNPRVSIGLYSDHQRHQHQAS